MGHLRKKIKSILYYDYNIHVFCEFVPIINHKCLEFIDFGNGNKHLFYYLYDDNINIKKNVEIIKEIYLKHTNINEIIGCIYHHNGKQLYKTNEEYNNCKEYCIYGQTNCCKIRGSD